MNFDEQTWHLLQRSSQSSCVKCCLSSSWSQFPMFLFIPWTVNFAMFELWRWACWACRAFVPQTDWQWLSNIAPLNRNPLRPTLEYTLVPKPVEQRRALNKQIKGRLTVDPSNGWPTDKGGLRQFTALTFAPNKKKKKGDSAFILMQESAIFKTSQELRMLSSVTLDCQVTKIVMNSQL